MPLHKVTIAISDELLAAADKRASSENSSRSRIVAAALEAYLGGARESEGTADEDLGMLMVPRETVTRLEAELEKRERELRHKEELLYMKTDMIERLTAQYRASNRRAKTRLSGMKPSRGSTEVSRARSSTDWRT